MEQYVLLDTTKMKESEMMKNFENRGFIVDYGEKKPMPDMDNIGKRWQRIWTENSESAKEALKWAEGALEAIVQN